MGGGGTMRAAAKVVGFTAVNTGRRVFTADHYPLHSAIRTATSARPAEDVKLVTSPTHGGMHRAAITEVDDWIFAGEEEEVADPMPRVVFRGDAPTLQEAKEATSELADALEKAYLSSPNSVVHEVSSIADNGSCSSLSNSQVVENKSVTSEIVIKPAAPSHAIQAFKLLHESSAAQTVVASIACDPNVWNAVLKNEQLQEFLHSQKTFEYGVPADSDLFDGSSEKSFDASSEPEGGFMDFIQKIKSTLVDMMSSLSGFFQSFFGGQGLNRVFANSDGTARISADTVMEASFMGLAIMAIMVILMKRG